MCFFENTFFGNEKFMCILHKVTTMWEREWKFFFSCECRILAANSKGLALRLKTAFSLTQDMQMLKIWMTFHILAQFIESHKFALFNCEIMMQV